MKSKGRKKEKNAVAAFGLGLAVAAALELILSAVFAAATSGGMIGEGKMVIFSAVTALICSFAGALTGAKSSPELKFPVAAGIGGVMLAVNFAAGRAFSQLGGSIRLQIPIAFILGALLAGLIAVKKKKVRR